MRPGSARCLPNGASYVCDNDRLADLLTDAVIARDLPGMADIDASLLYFCRTVKKQHTVAVCGECADEIFAGYPWFFRRHPAGLFPWSPDLFQTRPAAPAGGRG